MYKYADRTVCLRSIHFRQRLATVMAQKLAPWSVVHIHQNTDRLLAAMSIHPYPRTLLRHQSTRRMTRFSANYRYNILGLDSVEWALAAS